MFVGGEFYVDDRWLADQATFATEGMTFLNGGKACLIVIADYLRAQGIETILLPAYLCPDIVSTLERCGLRCTYYAVRPDFSIDLADLEQKAAGQRAIYFINYFGFSHSPTTQKVLLALQRQGKLLVEDNAQAAFRKPVMGNFAFNSLRKFCAHDGGYLTTKFDVTDIVRRHSGAPNRRLPVVREYRQRLADYLYQGSGSYNELVRLYELSERYYLEDMAVAGDPQEQAQIERMDWAGIRQVRRENYAYLLEAIRDIPELIPIFPEMQADATPLGLPVYVSGIPRDRLWDSLGEAGIGLTIHWDGLLRDPRLNGNAAAVDMAGRILTLVIDQRTSHKQLDSMVETIRRCLRR